MDHNLHQAVVALALRQNGNVSRRQLLDLGLGGEAIKSWIRSGFLHRVHRGVYAVGRPPRTALERAGAAVLACGPGAALSHASAMTLWELWKYWAQSFEVVVLRDRRPKGITVHHPRNLHRRDVRTQRGIRVTSPARTLHDMAGRLTQKQLTRGINDALLSNFLKQSQLEELVARLPDSPLARFVRLAGLTRSELEDEFLAFCERYGLPTPETNVLVGGYLADAYFERERVIVELDGWDFHSTRASFEGDRERDADNLGEGIPTIRITHDRLADHPDREAARLHRILASRR